MIDLFIHSFTHSNFFPVSKKHIDKYETLYMSEIDLVQIIDRKVKEAQKDNPLLIIDRLIIKCLSKI